MSELAPMFEMLGKPSISERLNSEGFVRRQVNIITVDLETTGGELGPRLGFNEELPAAGPVEGDGGRRRLARQIRLQSKLGVQNAAKRDEYVKNAMAVYWEKRNAIERAALLVSTIASAAESRRRVM